VSKETAVVRVRVEVEVGVGPYGEEWTVEAIARQARKEAEQHILRLVKEDGRVVSVKATAHEVIMRREDQR
jgi:hypothetical protein